MLIDQRAPRREDLVADLKLLREKGLPELDDLELPTLQAAASIVTPEDAERDSGAAVETLLRRAAARLGGGRVGDAVQALYGLDGKTRTLTAGVRRTLAAEALGCSIKTFLRRHEGSLLRQTARQILVLCNEQGLREGRERLAAASPVESGMAVQWLERFQAYYRMWSPINGLGADLTAYRMTLLEHPRPYDRRFGTEGPEDEGYSQEEQAEGYAGFALYHFAHFEWQLRQFINRYGGLWLLSEPDVELAVSEAAFRIGWHDPFNERDHSFLRTLIDETPREELHGYLKQLASTEIGRETHREWQEWCEMCDCQWAPGSTTEADYFPTAPNQPGISEKCQLHQVVEACGTYCDLIDQEWRQIADWYHLKGEANRLVSAEHRYSEWRVTSSR